MSSKSCRNAGRWAAGRRWGLVGLTLATAVVLQFAFAGTPSNATASPLSYQGLAQGSSAEVPSAGGDKNVSRYEQTLMVPQFLDLEKLTASHRHGMLRLTLPLKDSVKPRRVQIETQVEDHKQLAGVR